MINIGTNIAKCGHKISLTPTGGYQTITEYEGTRDAIEGYAFSLPQGLSYFIDDSEKPKCKLIVSTPYLDAGNTTPEAPTEIWELPGNALLKDVYEHKDSLSLGSRLLSGVKRAVDIASGSSSGATAYVDALTAIAQAGAATTGQPASSAADVTSAVDLFNGILRGTTNVQVSQYVLRHTRVVGQKNALALVYAGVGKVYSVTQINAEDPIPAGLVFNIGNIPAPAAQTGYTWGWLKQTPSSKVVAGGRIEVSQEWWLEQWWNRLYPNL